MKVVNSKQLDADLKVVADAIRAKSGTSENLEFPDGMKEAIEGIEAGAIDFSSGFDDTTHSLWGVWRLNADPHWAMSSGNSTINFTFYGYVDGVYKNGVSAHFQDTYTGPTYLYVENVLVWDYMDGVANVNKLTDSLVSFGATPQTFTDTYFYDAFKARASLVTVEGGGDNIQTQEKTVEITESGTVEVLPDEGYLLSKVTANVNVSGGGGDSGEKTKLAQLIDKSIAEVTAADLKGATTVSQTAFKGCKSLISIELPASATSIGYEAFRECTSLINIKIPAGVTTIATNAFYSCTSLISIELPASVTSIDGQAFFICSALERIIVKATTPPKIATNTFNGIPSTCIFEVPSAYVEAYKVATNWSAKADQIVASEEF